MTIEELISGVSNLCENSVKKLNVQAWTSLEISRIVNRRQYWWRKKSFTFDSVAGHPLYNLSDKGDDHIDAAPDFVQMASPLYQWDSDDAQTELPFQGQNSQILKMRYSTRQGTPSIFTVEPGRSQTLRLTPVPNSAITYRGLYYAGVILDWSTPGQEEIPLIPPAYHYVAMLSMIRRAFMYLYGQKDPRFPAAVQDEQMALRELDAYRAPSTLHAVDFRSNDSSAFVQSTL